MTPDAVVTRRDAEASTISTVYDCKPAVELEKPRTLEFEYACRS